MNSVVDVNNLEDIKLLRDEMLDLESSCVITALSRGNLG